MSFISNIYSREILDSRGLPALEVELTLDNKTARIAIPSGASTGAHEALELRDQDLNRFHGKGLLKSISIIKKLSDKLKKYSIDNQSQLDSLLNKWDGTPHKSNFGANTILGISLAYAKAKAYSQNLELFQSFGDNHNVLPVPLINILNGGVHANNGLDVQEFMIVPYGFTSFKEAIRAAAEVFYCLKQILKQKKYSTSVGDEGGFAPLIFNNEEAIILVLEAIKKAGYCADTQIALALDVAASELYNKGFYNWEKQQITSNDLISIYNNWSNKYPIISIEDGLGEEDWSGWAELTKKVGHIQLVGDDIFVTQISYLKKGIKQKVANCLLAKINQVGTITETTQAIELAHKSNYTCCVSHRSGETQDTSIADLSIAWGAEQIKTGSVCRGERVAKYNRFLKIEEILGKKSVFAGKKAFPLKK